LSANFSLVEALWEVVAGILVVLAVLALDLVIHEEATLAGAIFG